MSYDRVYLDVGEWGALFYALITRRSQLSARGLIATSRDENGEIEITSSYYRAIDRHSRISSDAPCSEDEHIFEHEPGCNTESHCQLCCSDMPRYCLVCRRAIGCDGRALAP